MMKKTFRKILIANRAEIALRVMRTCRAMGIATTGVYSDADIDAPHTRFADEAVHIGPSPGKDSYLNLAKIIEAAQRSGADAIHPGYGFLSENAEFAEACARAGIIFIGPSPRVIRQMGLKSAARRLMSEAGVRVVPGYDGEDQGIETLRAQIRRVGFPVLIKASAGGGGKGIRVARSDGEVDDAVEAARRAAEKSFGDGSLLIERYVEHARHVEIQIMGDNHGNLVHLFERDCSLQRRHQKIIEESPSPAVNDELRRAMGEAAVKAGRAINYTNAGTVEFILAPSGEFYFIEANTRLQVEHPVTEMITGIDLVRLQIEIAEGKPLPFSQNDLQRSGHAIEARLYAEDPQNNFLPSTGKIHDWKLPREIDGLRIDAGVDRGTEVGIYYDPMLAKFIAFGEDRQTALRKLSFALRASSIQGLSTNRDFLIDILESEEFGEGNIHTGFIDDRYDLSVAGDDPHPDRASLVAVAIYLQEQWRKSNSLLAGLPPGYRNNPFRDLSLKLQIDKREAEVVWRQVSDGNYEVKIFDSSIDAQVLFCTLEGIRLALNGVQRHFRIVEVGDNFYVHSSVGSRVISRIPRHPVRHSVAEEGSANSPMPGQVLKILVVAGQKVSAGDPLIILEAMKMEHTMRAAVDGVIETVLVSQGEVVGPGQVLVQIAAL